jgi:hypothetical protein
MRVYCASSMTGRTGAELIEQSKHTAFLAWCYEIEILDPIVSENVEPNDKPLSNGGELLVEYWKRDKEMIRKAHVLIDLTGPAKSEGVAHEIAYARFHLHKPVVRVWPGLKASVARLEDDLIVDTLEEAFRVSKLLWGTPLKRLQWKWMIFKKSYLGLLKVRLNWFLDWRD